MNLGGDTAQIMTACAVEVGKDSAKGITKIGGELLKYLLAGLLKKATEKMNTGEINMKKLLKSGEELEMININRNDAKIFTSKAKKLGLTFSCFDKKDKSGDGEVTYAFKASDVGIVKKILEKMEEEKLKGIKNESKDDINNEYLMNGTYFVDKNNPENFIEVNAKQQKLQETILVDKNNPNVYMKMTEDIKNKTFEVEIVNKDGVNKMTKGEFSTKQIQEKVVKKLKDFEYPDVVYSDEELMKLKEKANVKDSKDKDNKGKNNEDRKTMIEIEGGVKMQRAIQPKKEKNKSKQKERSGR